MFTGRIEGLIVSARDDEVAARIHKRFLGYEGSQHIANRSTLRWFAALMRTFRPERILELGAGIGTMTELMLMPEYEVRTVFTTETDKFCLDALSKNLTNPNDPRLRIFTTEPDLHEITEPLDLVVGDGGFYSALEFQNCREGTLLFFDGNRSKLRAIAQETLKRKHLKCDMRQLGTGRKVVVWSVRRWWGVPIPVRRKQRDCCWIGMVERI